MSAPLPEEQAALLRAIVSHAEDDTPRLVYADWLEEHGDAEQAEFIRESIKLAAMKPRAKGRKALRERLAELVSAGRYRWYRWLGAVTTVAINRFNRGLPYRVTFGSPGAFFAVADALFAFVPVSGLGITTVGGSEFDNDSLRRFAAVPGLARLTDLRLFSHARVACKTWRVFFRSPHLSGLTRLYLPGCGLYGAEVTELAAAGPLANLTELDLSFNSIGVDGARAILDSPHLTKLKLLWLSRNFFGDEDGEDEVLEDWEQRLGDGLHVHESPDEGKEELM